MNENSEKQETELTKISNRLQAIYSRLVENYELMVIKISDVNGYNHPVKKEICEEGKELTTKLEIIYSQLRAIERVCDLYDGVVHNLNMI